MTLSGQDVVRQTLEGNPNIVEVEVEYRKGNKDTFNLLPGNSASRQDQIDRLLDKVRWEKVEEVEIEYVDGYKDEIDLEAKLDVQQQPESEPAPADETVDVALTETAAEARSADEPVAEARSADEPVAEAQSADESVAEAQITDGPASGAAHEETRTPVAPDPQPTTVVAETVAAPAATPPAHPPAPAVAPIRRVRRRKAARKPRLRRRSRTRVTKRPVTGRRSNTLSGARVRKNVGKTTARRRRRLTRPILFI
ncbi:hypothetical protein [Cohnella panacarvi]|uniref:hypothetical protein n=1 Tax=Cohnella panacarvi TaxID=400776 RepID=UPI0004AF45CE|nr:hypothetical protein [Cohnella panacarvi]